MSVNKLVGEIPTKTNNRYYKVGDVLRWIPRYLSQEKVDERGLAIVISSDGPIFEAYWIGTKEIDKHDARGMMNFRIQDIAPLPEVAEVINKVRGKNESRNPSQV